MINIPPPQQEKVLIFASLAFLPSPTPTPHHTQTHTYLLFKLLNVRPKSCRMAGILFVEVTSNSELAGSQVTQAGARGPVHVAS